MKYLFSELTRQQEGTVKKHIIVPKNMVIWDSDSINSSSFRFGKGNLININIF